MEDQTPRYVVRELSPRHGEPSLFGVFRAGTIAAPLTVCAKRASAERYASGLESPRYDVRETDLGLFGVFRRWDPRPATAVAVFQTRDAAKRHARELNTTGRSASRGASDSIKTRR